MARSKEICFISDERNTELELHSRLFDNPQLMTEAHVSESLRSVPISERISLKTLGEADLFAYLCAHGAVDRWFRLKWLADIGALLAQQRQDGPERLYCAAVSRGAGRPAAQALLLCHRLLGTSFPDGFVAMLRQDIAVRWLEVLALQAMTADREPTKMSFGTTRSSFGRFLLGRTWLYWMRELKLYATSPVDILMLPLPKHFLFLYPVLRLPLWLWRRYVHRPAS